MSQNAALQNGKRLTFARPEEMALSIRATALVFEDPASTALLSDIELIAAREVTAMIIGETGTGKELVARHIHAVSGRAGPFVAVNCGALSEALIDAELFGHEAGAYTGASHARAGWFEAANGGTLFLDEIGDMPAALQVKLLRVLQERQVVRLGSRSAIPVDVRLIAATNVDLWRAVNAGRFRADLYYRLNVAPIRLPPLRERRGDIPPLVDHFAAQYARRLDIADVNFTPRAREALVAHDWPGNIRELENVVHYALIVSRDGRVDIDDLRLANASLAPAAQPPVALPADTPAQLFERIAGDLRRLIELHVPELHDTMERILVSTAFESCRRNQVHTAEALSVSRYVLRTQLKRHDLLDTARQGITAPQAS